MLEDDETESQTPVFMNMQHAIVEALHVLGKESPYNDGSARMREIFSKVEHVPINVNGTIDRGPHRFSIFNSSLCGRRSAAELFERIEDSTRQGAWWKLRKSYDDSIRYACQQKGIKEKKTRNRRTELKVAMSESPSASKVPWDKNGIMNTLKKIEDFAIHINKMREENVELKDTIQAMKDDVAALEQAASPELKEKFESYKRLSEQVAEMRKMVIASQEALKSVEMKALSGK